MDQIENTFVYMLTNDRGNVLYVGSTLDLRKRLYFHKKRMIAGFTKKYNVHRLVYFECHESLASARRRERKFFDSHSQDMKVYWELVKETESWGDDY